MTAPFPANMMMRISMIELNHGGKFTRRGFLASAAILAFRAAASVSNSSRAFEGATMAGSFSRYSFMCSITWRIGSPCKEI